MTSSRVSGALLVLLAVSIDGRPARSQVDDDEASDPASAPGPGSGLAPPADPIARRGWLEARVQAAIAARPTLARARLGLHVVDLATGDAVVSREPDRGLNLASNAKLLTSVAALATLGGGFRWRTAVFCKPPDRAGVVTGDLYLRGRGDPVLGVDGLRELAQEVAARGVRTVEGRLIVDATYFDDDVEPPHFTDQPKERAAFRAPVASLSVARGAFTVIVMPEPGGAPATIRIDPPLPGYLELTRQEVTTIETGRSRLRLDVKPKRDRLELELTGRIRAAQGTWDLRRRVDDPARFAAEVFVRALADAGVRLRSRVIRYAAVPTTLRPIAIHVSPPLTDVLHLMNKHSDNNVAETVLKTLGAETRATPGPATWADGLAALRARLAKLGVTGAYRVENGSGLFASTQVSPRQLVAVLTAAHADYRIGPDLVGSLPVGGHDGTLARRFHGRLAQGRVRAKTGTLDKVITLSGFVGVDGGHPLAFAILFNDVPPGQRPVARALIDDVVDLLAAYLDAR